MNIKSELEKNKYVKSVEPVDLRGVLRAEGGGKKILAEKYLKAINVYRFVYTVTSKEVVGYVSIPKMKEGEKLPCIIHLRGGSGEFGRLDPSSLPEKLVKYSAEGYVVIATQYPGVEGGTGKDSFGGPDDILSILKLKDILKSIPVADAEKIGVKGHSRGGLMVYMLLREVRWVKCAVISGAPVDQIREAEEREGWRKHQVSMWGASRGQSLRRSPIFWVGEMTKKTPILLMHGSSDRRVSPQNALRMSAAMTEAVIPHRFLLFEGADHVITEHKEEYFAQTLCWFERFLKNKELLPDMKPHGK
ncbi:MAG TPA: prolyl oligopeptidase family serine peptidase [Candidatus Paceibacterota bacterium]|nr:prolyl oligopeptidase family serine peptidase [Candidatus Paceibacterota bacterium]